MFILKRATGFIAFDYYQGKTYVVQGETYPVVTSNPREAKKYASRKRAENSIDSLNVRCGGIWEIDEDDFE